VRESLCTNFSILRKERYLEFRVVLSSPNRRIQKQNLVLRTSMSQENRRRGYKTQNWIVNIHPNCTANTIGETSSDRTTLNESRL